MRTSTALLHYVQKYTRPAPPRTNRRQERMRVALLPTKERYAVRCGVGGGVTLRRAQQRGPVTAAVRKWYNRSRYKAGGVAPAVVIDINNNRSALPAYGTNLGASGYSASYGGASLAEENPSGTLTITGDGTNTASMTKAVSTTVGKLYVVQANISTASITLRIGTTFGGYELSSTGISAPATYLACFTAVSTTTYISWRRGSVGSSVITNINVAEVMLGDIGTNQAASGYTLTPGAGVATESPAGTLNLSGGGVADKTIETVVGRSYICIVNVATNGVVFRVGTSVGGSELVYSSMTAGSWYSFIFTATTTTTYVRFSRGSAAPEGVASGIVISEWFPSPTLRLGTIEECFVVTATSTTARYYMNSSGVLKNDLSADTLRYDWWNGKRQLRVDASAQNLLTYSTNVNHASWSRSNFGTILLNNAVGPTNATDAAFIPETSGSAARQLAKGGWSVTSGTTYTATVIAKYAGRAWLKISLDSGTFGSSNVVWYNLQTGTLGTVQGSTTATIKALANGYYQCTYTRTATASAGSAIYIGICSADRGTTYTGDGTSGIYFWNADVVANPFASAPIISTTSSVTRANETIRFSPLIEALLQRAAATIRVSGQGLYAVSSGPRIVGIASSASLLNRSTSYVEMYDGTTTLTEAAGVSWSSSWGVASTFNSTGRSVSGGGAAVTDTNQPGTRSTVYLGRDGSATAYASCWYDLITIHVNSTAATALKDIAKPV